MERRVIADDRDRALGLEVVDVEHKTKGAAVVISDVNTGEVLAMVSHPSYDNQLFVDGISSRKYQELTKDPQDPLFDKSFMGKYPPGSTIKPFMALTGLREGVITGDSTFTCRGGIKVLLTFDRSKGQDYNCWNLAGDHGELNLENAINQSCDVYFYNVGVSKGRESEDTDLNKYFDRTPLTGVIGEEHTFQGLGIAKIHSALTKRFWYNKATGIDLPLESNGFVGDDEWKRENLEGSGWTIGDSVNASIGQGYVEASPLQMAVNTAALANGGTVWKPRVVQAIVDDNGAVLQSSPPSRSRKIKLDPGHLGLVLGAMKRVATTRTAAPPTTSTTTGPAEESRWLTLNPEGEKEIFIGGKTGTAEFGKSHPTTKNDDGTPLVYYDYHAWFTCFAPHDKPEIAVAVFVESGGQGGTNAVPIADKALRAYFESTGRRSAA
jgi:penicillin-binding protein 2